MKKIDIAKSTVLGTNNDDTDGLKLGISGYFSHYSNFETYVDGELDGFTYSEFMTTQEDPDGEYGDQWYDYFIPKDKVVFIEEEKEKKLRPFKDWKEFTDVTGHNIGGVITVHRVDNRFEETCIINGYKNLIGMDVVYIMLGTDKYTLEELSQYFKYQKYGQWFPFGVEE